MQKAVQKKCMHALIFLDTEFHEIYTFVSCTRACCSVDLESIGRIGKWQPRKQQPRRQRRRQPRRSNPTPGKRKTGDAVCVPRFCVCFRASIERRLSASPWESKDIPRPGSFRCCSPRSRTAPASYLCRTAPARRGFCPSSQCCGRRPRH